MALPTGPAVTFLFTDIEGSTRLERAVGSAEWARLVARHDGLLRSAIETAGGAVVKTEGDAFFAAFARPGEAAAAAVAAQRAIGEEPWPADAAPRVRMGLLFDVRGEAQNIEVTVATIPLGFGVCTY